MRVPPRVSAGRASSVGLCTRLQGTTWISCFRRTSGFARREGASPHYSALISQSSLAIAMQNSSASFHFQLEAPIFLHLVVCRSSAIVHRLSCTTVRSQWKCRRRGKAGAPAPASCAGAGRVQKQKGVPEKEKEYYSSNNGGAQSAERRHGSVVAFGCPAMSTRHSVVVGTKAIVRERTPPREDTVS